jgi:beta-lactamase regulating signal transducer with metallopeptidase domain
MIRINKNLALFSGLFLILGTILLFIFQKLSPLLGHVTYYCQSFIDTHMIPIPYYLSIIPFGFLSLILGIAVIKFLVLNLKIQFLKYKLKGNATVQGKVSKLIKHLGLQEKTIIIKSTKQFAFCLGIRSPKIYISTGLLSKLTSKEIEAVLRHEQYHLESHDTFTMIVASVAHSMFPFFPLLGDLIKKYRVDREIEADRFAVNKIVASYSLIHALKKLLAFPTVETVPLAAIADQDTLEPRIYSLLNKQYTCRQFRLRNLFITLFSSLLVGAILITPVHAKEIHHMEHDVMMLCTDGGACMNFCASEERMSKLYSEMPSTSQSFTPAH